MIILYIHLCINIEMPVVRRFIYHTYFVCLQIFYELTQTVRASEELLLGKREPLNLDAAFGELMTTSAEDRSERDSGEWCFTYVPIIIISLVSILIFDKLGCIIIIVFQAELKFFFSSCFQLFIEHRLKYICFKCVHNILLYYIIHVIIFSQ